MAFFSLKKKKNIISILTPLVLAFNCLESKALVTHILDYDTVESSSGELSGSITIDETTGEATDTKKKIKEILHPRKCYNILRNISDEDTYLLGFNPKISRPEDFICVRFPIPPVIIRPTAKIDFLASSTMEDSLTLKIADIAVSCVQILF